jgi:hypothetical protein
VSSRCRDTAECDAELGISPAAPRGRLPRAGRRPTTDRESRPRGAGAEPRAAGLRGYGARRTAPAPAPGWWRRSRSATTRATPSPWGPSPRLPWRRGDPAHRWGDAAGGSARPRVCSNASQVGGGAGGSSAGRSPSPRRTRARCRRWCTAPGGVEAAVADRAKACGEDVLEEAGGVVRDAELGDVPVAGGEAHPPVQPVGRAEPASSGGPGEQRSATIATCSAPTLSRARAPLETRAAVPRGAARSRPHEWRNQAKLDTRSVSCAARDGRGCGGRWPRSRAPGPRPAVAERGCGRRESASFAPNPRGSPAPARPCSRNAAVAGARSVGTLLAVTASRRTRKGGFGCCAQP